MVCANRLRSMVPPHHPLHHHRALLLGSCSSECGRPAYPADAAHTNCICRITSHLHLLWLLVAGYGWVGWVVYFTGLWDQWCQGMVFGHLRCVVVLCGGGLPTRYTTIVHTHLTTTCSPPTGFCEVCYAIVGALLCWSHSKETLAIP